eukprot:353578-Chlamydomonas_euryale.AAC.2
MGLSCNGRYQALGGADYILVKLMPLTAFRVYQTGIRALNNVVGGEGQLTRRGWERGGAKARVRKRARILCGLRACMRACVRACVRLISSDYGCSRHRTLKDSLG